LKKQKRIIVGGAGGVVSFFFSSFSLFDKRSYQKTRKGGSKLAVEREGKHNKMAPEEVADCKRGKNCNENRRSQPSLTITVRETKSFGESLA
jgi:hypothetical protein